ncbi:MAG: DUF488 family protein [Calditrichaeota bacterium]|nr:MAG: DUF488 family protein [Calditrichota bacterium]
MIKVKSVYAKASEEDGERILVDRFWPEGLKTHLAQVDEWMSELGPSYDLQRFFWDVKRWDEYRAKYEQELLADGTRTGLLEQLAQKAQNGTLTLLYGNRDPEHNHAVVLKELIEDSRWKTKRK